MWVVSMAGCCGGRAGQGRGSSDKRQICGLWAISGGMILPCCALPLLACLPAPADGAAARQRSASASPADRAATGQEEEAATEPTQPRKRVSRWLEAAAEEEAQQQRRQQVLQQLQQQAQSTGGGGGGAADANSDVEQMQQEGEGGEAGDNANLSPQRPT